MPSTVITRDVCDCCGATREMDHAQSMPPIMAYDTWRLVGLGKHWLLCPDCVKETELNLIVRHDCLAQQEED